MVPQNKHVIVSCGVVKNSLLHFVVNSIHCNAAVAQTVSLSEQDLLQYFKYSNRFKGEFFADIFMSPVQSG